MASGEIRAYGQYPKHGGRRLYAAGVKVQFATTLQFDVKDEKTVAVGANLNLAGLTQNEDFVPRRGIH